MLLLFTSYKEESERSKNNHSEIFWIRGYSHTWPAPKRGVIKFRIVPCASVEVALCSNAEYLCSRK